MPIPSKPVTLVRFRWKLADLTPGSVPIPKPFVLRQAGEEELEDALRVVQASYNLDPEWSGCAKHIDEVVLPGVRKVFGQDPTCLFLQHGNRVIAASAFNPEPENGIHLVTGPCVFIEYRNRGIGGALLHATLEALRERGATEACGQARPGTPSAKFLCSKFGGQPLSAPAAKPDLAETTAVAA
ncbi:MAG: GNAT family N-acetyltransferase [Chthoniobacterales bacterium]